MIPEARTAAPSVEGQYLLGEGVGAFRAPAGDMAVAKLLADGRAVLALDEGVVVAASGSGPGLDLVNSSYVEGFEQAATLRLINRKSV